MLIERIVSGGQTGADRAGLDWALEHGVPQTQGLFLDHWSELDLIESRKRAADVEVLRNEMPGIEIDDNDRLLGAGSRSFLYRVLDGWPIHDREEGFRHDACGRPHSRTPSGSRYKCYIDAHELTFCSEPENILRMLPL